MKGVYPFSYFLLLGVLSASILFQADHKPTVAPSEKLQIQIVKRAQPLARPLAQPANALRRAQAVPQRLSTLRRAPALPARSVKLNRSVPVFTRRYNPIAARRAQDEGNDDSSTYSTPDPNNDGGNQQNTDYVPDNTSYSQTTDYTETSTSYGSDNSVGTNVYVSADDARAQLVDAINQTPQGAEVQISITLAQALLNFVQPQYAAGNVASGYTAPLGDAGYGSSDTSTGGYSSQSGDDQLPQLQSRDQEIRSDLTNFIDERTQLLANNSDGSNDVRVAQLDNLIAAHDSELLQVDAQIKQQQLNVLNGQLQDAQAAQSSDPNYGSSGQDSPEVTRLKSLIANIQSDTSDTQQAEDDEKQFSNEEDDVAGKSGHDEELRALVRNKRKLKAAIAAAKANKRFNLKRYA